jgi:hypothetical protein
MITCKSPVAVMRSAHELGAELFDEHAHRFSRHDFTLPQLFACVVLREHQKKSYRGTEALLADCADLRDAVGLASAPDHNTIWRAFEHLVKPANVNRALDLMVVAARRRRLKVRGDSVKPAALDSTCFESRHVSRHFERRQRQAAKQAARRARRGRAKKRP